MTVMNKVIWPAQKRAVFYGKKWPGKVWHAMHNLHLSLVHGTPYYAEPPIPHKKFFREKQELNLLKLFIGYIIYSLPFVS